MIKLSFYEFAFNLILCISISLPLFAYINKKTGDILFAVYVTVLCVFVFVGISTIAQKIQMIIDNINEKEKEEKK